MSQPISIITIRTATPADASAVAAIYAPYVLETPVTFEEVPPTADEFQGRIRDTLTRNPFLVAEIDGRIAGYAYASPRGVRASFRWSIDVAIYVDATAARGGVGRALYARLLPILKAQGYVTAYAVIAIPNPPSVAFHESLGFRHVATLPAVGYKLGAWRDVGWWALPLIRPLPAATGEPPGEPPAEPVAFPDLLQTEKKV